MIVYMATNQTNGKRYIGISKISLSQRQRAHIRSAKKQDTTSVFHFALRKYGENAFTWEILEELEGRPYSDLQERERFWISEHKTHVSQFGYNMTLGGDGNLGWTPSEATKEKIRQSCKQFMAQNPHSAEAKQKMSIASKEWLSKNAHPQLGKSHSKELIEQIQKTYRTNRIGGLHKATHDVSQEGKESQRKAIAEYMKLHNPMQNLESRKKVAQSRLGKKIFTFPDGQRKLLSLEQIAIEKGKLV